MTAAAETPPPPTHRSRWFVLGYGAAAGALWLKGAHDEARRAWQTGAAIRHSPFAAAARGLLELADSGGSVPRTPLG